MLEITERGLAHGKEVLRDFALQHSAFTARNFHTRSTDVSRAARLFGSLTDTWELGNVTFGITCPTFTGARTIRQYSHDDAHDHVDLRRTVIDTSARRKQWEHERRSYHDSASASELLTRQKYRQKRNYTMWRLTHAHERPTRGQSNEERETERERNGKLVADATTLCECVYAHVCERRRVEREPKEKKGRVVTHVDA